MELTVENTFAAPVIPGVEDKFYYVISEDCVMCASCAEACPVPGIDSVVRKTVLSCKSAPIKRQCAPGFVVIIQKEVISLSQCTERQKEKEEKCNFFHI